MYLVSAGFVLFVEVEYHQSCVDFPHRHLISWGDEQTGERTQRLAFGGGRNVKTEDRMRWGEHSWTRSGRSTWLGQRALHLSSTPRYRHVPWGPRSPTN